MLLLAASSHHLRTPTSSGHSTCLASRASTPLATSSVWYMRDLAGSFGKTKLCYQRRWSSSCSTHLISCTHVTASHQCICSYLGSVEYTFSLNFSKPAAPIIAQMFNFLNLGFQGYRDVAFKDLRNARLLARALEGTGYFKVSMTLQLFCTLSDSDRWCSGSKSDPPREWKEGCRGPCAGAVPAWSPCRQLPSFRKIPGGIPWRQTGVDSG